jgi:lipopolysaccharide assembly protein B
MDFDLQWLLIGLPVAFVLGWLASRLDLRQLKRDRRDAPRAYFEGLNLLLNEQQDKAIDAFIAAVQHDPDTTELHFALGNLFRRRGEFERSVRVHQHLLSRADLKAPERDRAQHALAQDYAKAGLFDRAEAAWRALLDTPYDGEARLALLSLYERSRDWTQAAATAAELERRGGGSFAARIAHYHCERALEADAEGRAEDAEAALRQAREVAPEAPRPLLLAGQRALKAGQPQAALDAWDALRERGAALFALVAEPYARAALACVAQPAARAALEAAYAREPRLELLAALDVLAGDPASGGEAAARRLTHLAQQPSLGAASAVLALDTRLWQPETREQLHAAVQRAAKPLQRYRCAACGFEAHHYFWQCPGCQGWDTYPPRLLEQQ